MANDNNTTIPLSHVTAWITDLQSAHITKLATFTPAVGMMIRLEVSGEGAYALEKASAVFEIVAG